MTAQASHPSHNPRDERPWTTLGTRVASALALLPIVITLVLLGGIPFSVLVALAGIVMAYEWAMVTEQRWKTADFAVYVFTVLSCVVLATIGEFGALLLIAVGGMSLSIGILEGWRRPVTWSLIGFPYIVTPLVAAIWLRSDPEYGRQLVLWVMAVVWATDTFAYFVGKSIGGPKLAPRISPKKTWAGLIGGTVAAALVGVIAAAYMRVAAPLPLIAMSVVLSLVGQAGDMFESSVKRHFHTKDSSHLIPGHGGLLDRIDALVFALVAAAIGALILGEGPSGVMVWE